MDLFLVEKALSKKKFSKFFFCILFYILEDLPFFFCLVELSFLDLDCLYLVAAIPHRRRIGGEEGSWGGDQVLWKPSGVVVQVAGLVTVPGGSWGGNLVFFKLSRVGVHLSGLVATPEGSWGGDQVFWKLSWIGVQVATPGGSWDGNHVLKKLQEIMVQAAELVTVPWRSWFGDHILRKLSGCESAGSRTCCNTWSKLRLRPGLDEAFRFQSSGGRTCYNTRRKLGWQASCVEAARVHGGMHQLLVNNALCFKSIVALFSFRLKLFSVSYIVMVKTAK